MESRQVGLAWSMNTAEPFLKHRFFPLKKISQVPLPNIQKALIKAFKRWGLPKSIKFDNGRPFADPKSETVPVLSLWLTGLNITVIWNRPRTPTDNAKVERSQGTSANWAEPHQCANLAELQKHLDACLQIQRERYPTRVCGRKTRAETFPKVWKNPRAYDPEAFDIDPVVKLMAKGKWIRKASSSGQVTFYNRRWQVGAENRSQYITITLDPDDNQWCFCNKKGEQLKKFPAEELDAHRICSLSLFQ